MVAARRRRRLGILGCDGAGGRDRTARILVQREKFSQLMRKYVYTRERVDWRESPATMDKE